MKKRAMTYYYDVLQGISHVEIHESGAEALRFFVKEAPSFFNAPIQWKNKPTLKSGSYSVRIGTRGYRCRFLTDEETSLVVECGEKGVYIDRDANIVAPPKRVN